MAYALQGSYTVTVVAADKAQMGQIKKYYGQKGTDTGYQLHIQYLQAQIWDPGIEQAVKGDYIRQSLLQLANGWLPVGIIMTATAGLSRPAGAFPQPIRGIFCMRLSRKIPVRRLWNAQ